MRVLGKVRSIVLSERSAECWPGPPPPSAVFLPLTAGARCSQQQSSSCFGRHHHQPSPAQPSPATGQENDDCRLTGHFTRRPQPPTPPPPHHHYTAFVTQVSRWYFSRNSLALYEQKCSRTLLQPLHSRYSTFWVCWPTHATLTVHIEMSLPTFGCLLWMFINGLSVNESILWGVGAYFRNRYLMRGAQCSAQQERFPRSLCSSPPTNVQPFDSPPRLRAADRSVYPDKDKNQWRAETDGVLFLLCVFLLSS